MSPRKPKEFLFKQKGRFNEGNKKVYKKSEYRNRQRGKIYLSHSHLRFVFKSGGDLIIPLKEIKNLSKERILYGFQKNDKLTLSITTDQSRYQFWAGFDTKRLYRLLCKVTGTNSSSRRSLSLKGVLQVFFGIIGIVLFFSGLYLVSVDFGFPSIVIPFLDVVFYLNPFGITFLVLSVVILSISFGEIFCFCD